MTRKLTSKEDVSGAKNKVLVPGSSKGYGDSIRSN
jgi:hypothetical protein